MTKLERVYSKRIQNVLKDQFQDAADYFQHGIGLESINDAVDFNRKDMTKAYTDLYLNVSTLFHNKAKGQIKSSYPKEVKVDEGAYWSHLNKWMERNIASKVTRVQNTTRRLLKDIVISGIEGGGSHKEIAQAILDFGAITEKWRALRIARTETHSAAVKATDDTLKEYGLPVYKIWSAAQDERTRISHIAVDGQKKTENEPFEVPIVEKGAQVGKEYLLFPGDPTGSPGNIINCRCVLLYETK